MSRELLDAAAAGQLGDRVAALERVLSSELPSQLRGVWPDWSSRQSLQIPTRDPRTFLQLYVDVNPNGLNLRMVANGYLTYWERSVFFEDVAA